LPSIFKTQNNHSSTKIATINPNIALSDPHFFALFVVATVGPALVVSVGPVFVEVVVIVVSPEVAVEVVGVGVSVVELSEVKIEGDVGHVKM